MDKESFVFGNNQNAYPELIETMFYDQRRIKLWDLHYSRLKKSLSFLKYPIDDYKEKPLFDLCMKKGQEILQGKSGIIRLSLCLKTQQKLSISIKTNPNVHLPKIKNIGISNDLFKNADQYSFLKTNSRAIFDLAKEESEAHHWYDILLKNQYGRITESTISNLFWIRDQQIFTPALAEGCIEGVMRAYLFQQKHLGIIAKKCEEKELKNADELFLTNAVRGIQSINKLGEKELGNQLSEQLIKELNWQN